MVYVGYRHSCQYIVYLLADEFASWSHNWVQKRHLWQNRVSQLAALAIAFRSVHKLLQLILSRVCTNLRVLLQLV